MGLVDMALRIMSCNSSRKTPTRPVNGSNGESMVNNHREYLQCMA